MKQTILSHLRVAFGFICSRSNATGARRAKLRKEDLQTKKLKGQMLYFYPASCLPHNNRIFVNNEPGDRGSEIHSLKVPLPSKYKRGGEGANIKG